MRKLVALPMVKSRPPSQMLERLGFTSAQLSTPVKDLSGGQTRRLQLMLILLDEPNVLILDEPSNDLDTDMLAAMEIYWTPGPAPCWSATTVTLWARNRSAVRGD